METEKKVVIQKLKKQVSSSIERAQKYYSILSDVNGLGLTNREIELVAFTAVKGNISLSNVREEFCKKYKTSTPTINNMVSKLKKVKIFVKEGSLVKVNPVICLDFNKEVVLTITLGDAD